MFLAPVGVEVLGRSWSVGDFDVQAFDDEKNILQVFFAEAVTVEVIDAQPGTASFAR